MIQRQNNWQLYEEREQGSTALDYYTELKVVYVDYTGRKREGNLY